MIAQWEAIYRLAAIMRDHVKESEDAADPGILLSDAVSGLLRENEQSIDVRDP